ncbi:MAG: DMT family transporter [Alphaproteobacteria bacterium]|nr:DMT family transporter [Alphaproteobacteria bacterium]
MMTYIIAFLSPLFYALSVIIESFLSLAVFKKPIVMLFFVSLTNALFVPLVLCLGTPTLPDGYSWLIYCLIACIDICYLYPYYKALKKTDTSIVSSLFALGKIFVPILAFILLQDKLETRQYIGFVIIILASAFLNKKSQDKFRLNQAFYLMFLSSFLLALRICIVKYVLWRDNNYINVLIYPNLISGLIPFTFLVLKQNRREISRRIASYRRRFKFFVVIEFLTFLAVSCSTIALSKLSPVISTAIEATEPLFVLSLAMIVNATRIYHFRENTGLFKKICCFILIILGIVLTCSEY